MAAWVSPDPFMVVDPDEIPENRQNQQIHYILLLIAIGAGILLLRPLPSVPDILHRPCRYIPQPV